MIDLLVRIGPTNTSNYYALGLERTLAAWEEVQEFFAEGRAVPLMVERAPEHWYEISVDASAMLEYTGAKLERARRDEERDDGSTSGESWKYDVEEAELDPPTIRLLITPRAAADADEVPLWLIERFLQQLFLAMNISTPGSCNLSPCEFPDYPRSVPLKLNADTLDDALFDALEERWPKLGWIPFRDTWQWLHRDLAYDKEVAETPSQKAFFSLLRICAWSQWKPENALILTQAFEGILDPGKNSILKTLKQRMDILVGSPQTQKKWFDQLYELRSRIVHGDAEVPRPVGTYRENDPAARLRMIDPALRKRREEMARNEGRAVAVLLALLQDMVVHNTRAYKFEQRLVREEWPTDNIEGAR